MQHGSALILGACVGAVVGDISGWLLGGEDVHYLFAGIGGGLGACLGVLFSGRIRSHSSDLLSTGTMSGTSQKALGALGLFMAVASLAVFVLNGKIMGLIGAVFFGLCAYYLIRHRQQE
jgi:hypothetical protein